MGEAGLGDSIVTMASSSRRPLRGETSSVRLECRVLIRQLLWIVGCLGCGSVGTVLASLRKPLQSQHYIKPDVLLHIHNPRIWEVDAGEL